MALFQTGTPIFEQYFSFDNDPNSGGPSFGNSPAPQHPDLYYPDAEPMFASQPYAFTGFAQRPSTPPFERSLRAGEAALNVSSWPFAPSIPSKENLPLSKLETQVDAPTSNLRYGLITPTSANLTPPTDPDSADDPMEPQASHQSETGDGEDGMNDEETKEAPVKPVRRRNRRPRKRREVDPNSPAELEKRSKFLERNRVAASKCRQKKKEWATDLEARARELQANKESLTSLTNSLKEEVLYLKGEMLKHSSCSCPQIKSYLQSQIGELHERSRKCSYCRHGAREGHASDGATASQGSVTEDDYAGSIAGTASDAMSPVSPAASML